MGEREVGVERIASYDMRPLNLSSFFLFLSPSTLTDPWVLVGAIAHHKAYRAPQCEEGERNVTSQIPVSLLVIESKFFSCKEKGKGGETVG